MDCLKEGDDFGWSLIEEGSFNRALREFEGKEDAKSLLVFGVALRKLGQTEKSIDAIRRSIELSETSRGHYEMGYALIKANDIDLAIKSFERAADIDNSYSKAFQGLCLALRKKKRLDEALKAIKKAKDADPEDAQNYFELGEVYFLMNNNEGAIEALNTALIKKPDHHRVMSELAYMYEIEDDMKSAAKYWKSAYETLPCTKYRKKAFFCEKKLERVDDPAIDPTDIYMQAQILAKEDDVEGAMRYFERCLESEPEYIEALISRALINYGKNDYVASIEDMSRVVGLDPRCQQAFYILGESYRKIKNERLAKKHLEMAAHLLPDDDKPHYSLSLMYMEGNFEGALMHLDAAIDRHPNSARYHISRGMVFEHIDRLGDAKKDFERALEIDPGLEAAKKRLQMLGKDIGAGIENPDELLEGYR